MEPSKATLISCEVKSKTHKMLYRIVIFTPSSMTMKYLHAK